MDVSTCVRPFYLRHSFICTECCTSKVARYKWFLQVTCLLVPIQISHGVKILKVNFVWYVLMQYLPVFIQNKSQLLAACGDTRWKVFMIEWHHLRLLQCTFCFAIPATDGATIPFTHAIRFSVLQHCRRWTFLIYSRWKRKVYCVQTTFTVHTVFCDNSARWCHHWYIQFLLPHHCRWRIL